MAFVQRFRWRGAQGADRGAVSSQGGFGGAPRDRGARDHREGCAVAVTGHQPRRFSRMPCCLSERSPRERRDMRMHR
jgi:hypothetical protein